MNYQQAMDYIEEAKSYGYTMGLDHIRELCERLGNPQDKLQFIHVAGTNGKGSVSAMLSSVLKANGYKTGTYSSPSVFSYEEKMRFQGKPVTKTMLVKLLEQVKEAADAMEMDEKGHPSVFEIETAAAFLYFVEKECDIAVLEAGLGGIEDATNIIKAPVLTVFASISLDHCDYLGDTIAKITEKKAGIIKAGCQVVTLKQLPESLKVLEKKAKELGCVIHVTDPASVKGVKQNLKKQTFTYKEFAKVEIPLLGNYQIANASIVLEAVMALQKAGRNLSEDKIRKGLLETEWPGRFTLIANKPVFMIDGAHNPDAAEKLVESIQYYFTNKRIIYIMGILKDKEYGKIIEKTCPLASMVITVATQEKRRTMTAYELAQEVQKVNPNVTAVDSVEEAVEMSYLLAGKDDVIIAFGSLSYLGKLMDIVKNKKK